jgi:hypothetical protein
MSELRTDFYTCRLHSADTIIMSQVFFKGDYSQMAASLKQRVERIKGNDRFYLDLRANLDRILHLNSYSFNDPTSFSERTFINKSRVFWAYSLSILLSGFETGVPANAISGTRLMTYENQGEIKHFMFHANKDVLSEFLLPLVIVIPYHLSGETLITDWYLSVLAQIENDAKLADEYHFAIAWLFMDGKNYTPEAGYQDALFVMERLNNEFMLDEEKIFLIGDCEGGRRALILGSMAPDNFSGIGVNCPLIVTPNSNLILDRLDLLKEIPVYVTHGFNDTETSVNHSRYFVSEGRKSGMIIHYEETDAGHYMIDKGYRRNSFEFFKQVSNGL